MDEIDIRDLMDQVCCLERGDRSGVLAMPSLQEVKGHRTDPRLSYKEDRARRGAGEGDE